MAIEAGVGHAAANSYVTVAEADAYFLARAIAAWPALTNAAKEASLISATDYIDTTYETQFKGTRASSTQALAWPREGVVVDTVEILPTVIPTRLKRAQMELALKASAGVLLCDETQTVRSEKVDVIEVTYSPGSTAGTLYTFVSRLLAPLVRGGASGGSFSQASLVRA